MNEKNKTVAVTGADGMIGANMLIGLAEAGYRTVLAVDGAGSEQETRYVRDLPHTAYKEQGIFLEKITHDASFDISAIIHLGACSDTTETDRAFLMRNNFEYSKTLFEYCARNNCRFIYASSAATYGNGNRGYDDAVTDLEPQNYYAESKHLFDLFVRDAQKKPIAWVGLKFINVYGPYESHKGRSASMVYHGYQQVKESGEIKLFASDREDYGDGEQKRDFIFVKDAVKVMLFFLAHPEKSGIFNVGTGKARTWNNLARTVFTALGAEPRITYIPIPDDLKGTYQYHTEADISSLREAGYTDDFLSLEEGVARYVKWIIKQEET